MSEWFVMFSVGEWGGIYARLNLGVSFRLTLGWFAFTFMFVDGDKVLATSALWSDLATRIGDNEILCDTCLKDVTKMTEEFYYDE